MKKVLIVAVITLSSLALLAQAPQRKMAGPGEGGPYGRSPEKLFEFLQLTEEQKSAWQAIHDEVRPTFEALASRQRDAHQQMGAALESANPDACAVGRLMIQVDAAGDERKALHQATEKQAVALLTAEQKTKYEAWKAAQHEADMKMRTPHP